MTLYYVKPTDLAQAIEFNANKIYMRYGQVIGVTVTSNALSQSAFVNLQIRPFNTLLYNNNDIKIYSLTLSQFQQITFRDYLPELFLYKNIHQTGTELDFDMLNDQSKALLTEEVERLKLVNITWIEPLAPEYWDGVSTTIPALLQTQLLTGDLPVVTNQLGSVASGIISSVLDSGLQTISFDLDPDDIYRGVYYLATSSNPSEKVKFRVNGMVSYANAEYVGKKDNLYIYKFYTLVDSNLSIIIKHTSSFNLRIFNKNPITNYAI